MTKSFRSWAGTILRRMTLQVRDLMPSRDKQGSHNAARTECGSPYPGFQLSGKREDTVYPMYRWPASEVHLPEPTIHIYLEISLCSTANDHEQSSSVEVEILLQQYVIP